MDKLDLANAYATKVMPTYNKIRRSNSLINEWAKHLRRKDNVEATTIKNFISQLGTTLEHIANRKGIQAINDDFIEDISLDDIKKYWDDVFDSPDKAPSSSKKRVKLSVIKSFFVRFLKKDWHLDDEFAIKKERKKLIVMDSIEVSLFMAAIDDPTDKLFFSLVLGSGCRREEAKYLYATNVDDKNMLLHIRITELHTPKRKKERDTTLAKETLSLIRSYQRPKAAEEKYEPLLVLNSRGKPLSMSTMRRNFLKYCKNAGIRSNMSIHKLRSTYSSLMARKYPLEKVHLLLGHDSMETTRKFYVDLQDQISITGLESPLDT